MSITVATVALNAAHVLALTLESALAQDHDDLEILVLDGASWDGTHDLLERYRGVVDRIEIAEDSGIFDAMNRAAALASKDAVLFLNAGDRFHTERSLSDLWRVMDDESAPDIVYGDHIYCDGDLEEFIRAAPFDVQMSRLRHGAFRTELVRAFPVHQSTLTRTALLRDLKYDTAFRVCADHDLLLRAAQAGAKIANVDAIVSHYQAGGYSARHATLCRLEFNALYRRYSERPATVDAALYGKASPFQGTRSLASGLLLAGAEPEAPADRARGITAPFREVRVEGLTFLTPERRSTSELRAKGVCEIEGQTIEVFVDDVRTRVMPLPGGRFELAVPFMPSLAPATEVALVPARSRRSVGASVPSAFALIDFAFQTDPLVAPLGRGERLAFNKHEPRCTGHVLPGWHGLESRCMWSRAMVPGRIEIASHDRVERICLELMANPAAPNQMLDVLLNGTRIATQKIGGAPERAIEVAPGKAWRAHGVGNELALVPSEARAVPGDRRPLGVALIAVRLA